MGELDHLKRRSDLFPQNMLETLLIHEVVRSRRYPNPLSIMYFALWFPKESTPQIIDRARQVTADLLYTKIRDADIPGFYEGGFLVILPATDSAGAKVLADRVCTFFGGFPRPASTKPFDISVCVGLASHPGGEGISAYKLLSEATAALKEAQRRGPRSVVMFKDVAAVSS